MSYAELHCLSNFSFLRGASHAHELVRRAQALGYSALAITDECSLSGIVRAHEIAKETDFKLIIGSEFRMPDDQRIVLLVPDAHAYTQLCELITRARRQAKKGSYIIGYADFLNADRCIGLWVPGQKIAEESLQQFAALPLTDRYIAFSHHLASDSENRLTQLSGLGRRHHISLIATGEVYYHERERRPLHDTLTAIRLKTTVDAIGRSGFANSERHLRPISTLQKLYPPELISNTLKVADQCHFKMSELHYEYPEELVPQGCTVTQHLRQLTEAGLHRRWPKAVPDKVRALVEKELLLIEELKYEHFFLTVADIVQFARSQNILCQGRGSAANSTVCYALGITEVDPARISMLFERFISKERAEPPDIDVDFEHQRREEVIQYIYNKYGRERAALAATVICYRTKMAVRDVGKALGLPLDLVDALSKSMYWFDRKSVLPDRLLKLGFDPESRLSQQLYALVEQLVGFPRHLSQHVGGFVISHHPLSTLVPVENAAMPDRTIIQWDKEDLETLGLLKVDCLALGMLSAIRRCLDMVGAYKGQTMTMADIPAEDPATYAMLCRGESVGVFQVESRAQMSMLPRLKPAHYYDLVVQVAIVRPGPIQGGMVHPYLRRRQGKDKISYPSPELEKVLGRTFGVPLFQEQVMEIAVVAAGFTPGEADHVRRSMAAWQRRGGLDHFHDKLTNGMLERGYTAEFAEQIYQQVLGFGSYGFPESHAASFALLAYVSAWLKCHEPAAFCAALLNAQPMGFYAPAQLVNEAQRNGAVFLPIDIRYSQWDSVIELQTDQSPAVRFGFRMASGMPKEEAERIVSERTQGPFKSIDELAARAQLSKKAINALAEANALQSLAAHRHLARWSALGVEHLPGFLAETSMPEASITLRAPSEAQNIVADYRSTGLTLGRHPLARLRPRLDALKVKRSEELAKLPSGRYVRIAGLVTHRQRPQTAAGIMFVSLEDETGISNLVLWKSVQENQRQDILSAQLMIVYGELQKEQGVIHVVAKKVRDYSHWLGQLSTGSRDFR
ncbi:error-prone DNA polymerase [Stenotrophobium rhamnosiphilum]|uniref:Error-prone DNA polymerase n=1 Tax=Stenotrophobium rhamnosiphilum TaxID=2029166 RepID=A0A2T5ME36_9GAMM|nr:error-prone DNA polymerase [Stenotrophobium rhamnosiphilum]PTU30840.1 error-prone DNA polymerase [Stenotrophobium rhamnosiphilum]